MDDATPKKRGRKLACPKCDFACAVGDHYCRDCGSSLDEESGMVETRLTRLIPAQIETALTGRLRDQKVVEVEIAQRLAERAMTWLKLVGFFAGIPLLVCGIALSLLGIKSYSDMQSAIEKAARLETLTSGAEKQFGETQKRIGDVDASLKSAQAQIEKQIATINQNQRSLQTQVQSIQDRLKFCPSRALSPELQNMLRDKLSQYISHLEALGFPQLGDQISVCLFSKEEPVTLKDGGVLSDDMNAFYQPSERTIYIFKDLAISPSVALREYSRYPLIRLAPWFETSIIGIELGEALSDYFAASFLDSPRLAEGLGRLFGVQTTYLRTLANDLTYSGAGEDSISRGRVWGGALWACRERLGRAMVDKIVLNAWRELDGVQGAEPDMLKRYTALLEKHELALRPGVAGTCVAEQATKRGLPR